MTFQGCTAFIDERWRLCNFTDIKLVYLLPDKWQNSPSSAYVNTKVIYLFASNWPLKFLVLFRSTARNSLTINGCDAVKCCADVYGPQTHTEFGDSVALAPALRSQFLFSFNTLTHVGRLAVKLGEDVQSRCWEELYWWKVYREMQNFYISGTAFCSTQLQNPNVLYLWDGLIHKKTPINLECIK